MKFHQCKLYRGVVAYSSIILSHNLVSNGWSFMKLLLSIYDHGVVINMKFCQDIQSSRGVIAL